MPQDNAGLSQKRKQKKKEKKGKLKSVHGAGYLRPASAPMPIPPLLAKSHVFFFFIWGLMRPGEDMPFVAPGVPGRLVLAR